MCEHETACNQLTPSQRTPNELRNTSTTMEEVQGTMMPSTDQEQIPTTNKPDPKGAHDKTCPETLPNGIPNEPDQQRQAEDTLPQPHAEKIIPRLTGITLRPEHDLTPPISFKESLGPAGFFTMVGGTISVMAVLGFITFLWFGYGVEPEAKSALCLPPWSSYRLCRKAFD